MVRKKIFGAGAVVLLVLLSLSPLVNSRNLEIITLSKKNHDKSISSFGSNCDLKIEFTECSLDYVEALTIYDKPSRSFYKLKYAIINNGDPYSGNVLVTLKTLDMKDHTLERSWSYFINLGRSESLNKSHEIENITSDWDVQNDQERYFAGRYVSLELKVLDDHDSFVDNNVDTEAVKFWKDNYDYEPTDPQVEAGSLLHTYKNVSVGRSGLWYFDVPFDPAELDEEIRFRLGYVGELLIHIYGINKEIRTIISDFIDFAISVSNDFRICLHWLEELFVWIASVVNGHLVEGGLLKLIKDFIDNVRPALERIKAEAEKLVIQVIVDIMNNLLKRVDEFESWKLTEPWKKDIKVVVKVILKNPNDRIGVYCRNDDDVKTGSTYYVFELKVSSLWDNEINYFLPHDCTVDVYNIDREITKHSMKLFSWAFSNGTIRIIRTFNFPRSRSLEDKRFLIQEFFIKHPFLKNVLTKAVAFISTIFLRYEKPKEEKKVDDFENAYGAIENNRNLVRIQQTAKLIPRLKKLFVLNLKSWETY